MKVFIPNNLVHRDNIRKVLRKSDIFVECYNDGSVVAFDESMLEDFITTMADYTSLDENTIGNLCEVVEDSDVEMLMESMEERDHNKTGSQIMNECVLDARNELSVAPFDNLIKMTENLDLNTINFDNMSYEELISYRNTLSTTAKKLEDSIAMIKNKLQKYSEDNSYYKI